MLNIQKEIERVEKLEERDFSLSETKREIFNILETLLAIIIEQQRENQALKDEINRLKGEHGKPEITSKNEPKNKGSKNEQLESTPKKPWKKSAKSTKVKIDRTEVITLDKSELPPDAVFKGYEEKIVQNIITHLTHGMKKCYKLGYVCKKVCEYKWEYHRFIQRLSIVWHETSNSDRFIQHIRRKHKPR
jgi:hypothetical protein